MIQLSDQPMIDNRQPTTLRLHPTQQLEQITAAQPSQVQGNQRVDRGSELVEQGSHRCRGALLTLEHVYEYIKWNPVISREIPLIL